MRLFIAYQAATNVLAVIIATDITGVFDQLKADDPYLIEVEWRVEDYGDIVQASQQPTYFDLEQILAKGW